MSILQLSTPLSVPLLFLIGIAAGGVATLAMDVVMARLDEGKTPPEIASGVLTDSHPDRAPDRLASAVHYIAGTLTGPLFVWLYLAAAGIFGGGVVAVVVAAAVCYPLMIGFFALVVLPRSRGLSRQRLSAIRRAWSIEAAVYLIVLAPVVGAAAIAL
ncbi:hypothetical protein D3D02_07420 [Halobellus sp. Atlit-38R]|uniref:hypothetical protein n=1 Tax=Halobellus sp. Atlit-38R TaxID=2282131 RepID=UPI000EF2945C|nr:hypothetical protein [Halobellus sp. Atlit-38R]RLM89691.1 hypothetical protein D3D02_07420 [Halobellus sp. Atlit-38R]